MLCLVVVDFYLLIIITSRSSFRGFGAWIGVAFHLFDSLCHCASKVTNVSFLTCSSDDNIWTETLIRFLTLQKNADEAH